MAGRGILAEYRRRNILEDIYFRERRFSGEKERGDFYFDRGTPRWILTGSKMSSNGFLTVALGETFLRKNNTLPSPSSQPFYSRSV